MKALITGASGFIGSHLAGALAARGRDVRCLLRTTSSRRWLDGLDYETAEGALDDRGALARAVAGVDVVFHLAGLTKAREERDYFRANTEGTASLAAAAAARETPPLFVLCSSQAAAGPCREVEASTEAQACAPVTPYGKSKLAAEEVLARAGNRLPYVILRPAAVYGPRDTELLLYFKFIARRLEPAIGWEDSFVSLCYVDDLVAALVAAGERPGARGGTFFIAHDEVLSWRAVGARVAAALGVRATLVRVPKAVLFGAATVAELAATLTGGAATLNRAKARELAQKRWVVDVGRAKAALDFRPRVDFAAGAKLTAAWYRAEGWL